MIEQIEWVACSERLPDDCAAVLMYTTDEDSPILVGNFTGQEWVATTIIYDDYLSMNDVSVTHWAPLPAGPRG